MRDRFGTEAFFHFADNWHLRGSADLFESRMNSSDKRARARGPRSKSSTVQQAIIYSA